MTFLPDNSDPAMLDGIMVGPWRTRLAKMIYWVSGKASKIKTPQVFYEIIHIDPEAEHREDMLRTRRIPGRRWSSCQFSMRLLKLSIRIDPQHWDHWALQHDRCKAEGEGWTCLVCWGHVDPELDEDPLADDDESRVGD